MHLIIISLPVQALSVAHTGHAVSRRYIHYRHAIESIVWTPRSQDGFAAREYSADAQRLRAVSSERLGPLEVSGRRALASRPLCAPHWGHAPLPGVERKPRANTRRGAALPAS